MRVAKRLWVPTMHSRDILLQAKGNHLDRVHSEQRIIDMIRRGVWSSRTVAQWRPRVSKIRLIGPSGYYSNEVAVKAARREASGLNKRAVLTKYLLKERNSSKPNRTRAKGSLPKKNIAVRKGYSLYLWVMLQKEVDEASEDDNEWEPRFRSTESSVPKASLNRWPGASICRGGEGLGSHPNMCHVVEKQGVNTTLALGHQADPVHRYKFHILQTD